MTPRSARVVVLAAALLGVAATARLGWWQLDRAAQKNALQAAIDARSAMPPLAAEALARDADLAAQQHWRPVRIAGRWLPQATVFLDNRQLDGHPGFLVVTPLRPDGANDVVLVQRGWAPRDAGDRNRLPDVPTPAGRVELVGLIAPPPARLFEFDGADSGPIRQNLDLAAFARETGLSLRPVSIRQQEGADDSLVRRWPRPAVDVHKHYGYAFQWFALALLITGLYVWFQLVRPRRRA